MAIIVDRFSGTRPFLYHLTAKINVPFILNDKKLRSTLSLLRMSSHPEKHKLVREKRKQHIEIDVNGRRILLRDQIPLHAGNMLLSDGWKFSDFVEHLNSRVFFWPGTNSGPIPAGERHFARYRDERPSIFRVKTSDIFNSNVPLFARYNSGSPRCSKGQRIPRGANTFAKAQDFEGTSSDVIEVTFEKEASLSSRIEISEDMGRTWKTRDI